MGRLEIWPGQRTLVVLPLLVSDDFLSTHGSITATAPATPSTANPVMPAMTTPVAPPVATPVTPPEANSTPATATGTATDTPAPPPLPDVPTTPVPLPDAAPVAMTPAMGSGDNDLANALKPLLSPQLSSALSDTGKFSIVRPYKFDPLLTRALLETRVTQDDANNFLEAPTRSNAQNILAQLGLEQPGMVAQVLIQSLRVGGTSAMPTVQLTVRGDLYQADSAEPFRSITVTSRPFEGKTPEDRLRAAAGEAFADVASAFVEPPASFDLPLPSASAAGMMTGSTSGGTSMPTMGNMPMQPPVSNNSTTPMPMTPSPATPTTPLTPRGTMGGPVAPQLPGSTPPLGVNVPGQN